MTVQEICKTIEDIAPLAYQESYDNAGLLVGDPKMEVTGGLISIDVTEEVVEEAIQKKCNLIVAHHPIIFGGVKRLTGRNYVERTVIKAIQNNIAIYAAHTNLDNVTGGVNSKIAEKLGLENCRILMPLNDELRKLVVFVPVDHAEKVRSAICDAGAGKIGNYDHCSYNATGQGTFRAGEGSDPFVGEPGKIHFEEEIRIETIFPKVRQGAVVQAMIQAHPYEEVAHDIYPIENKYALAGGGMIGTLPVPVSETDFLNTLKSVFGTGCIKHTNLLQKKIKKVALCGGSGSFMLKKAIAAKADVFVSGDFKYHEYFDAEGKILIADIGHYESEQFTKDVFYEILMKKFPKFALCLSGVETNPVNYL
ncbi:MAG: Nif3-like dinuclear metal center hexameric protein [Bacteroidales bacterium]|nr:Nif3-like dinuclear metal center hexameric protein [Bacteroidales bacterium]MCF8455132.1 Nif3-like dinuclear metal center hexameric protein [Bacteroidales bacterium]